MIQGRKKKEGSRSEKMTEDEDKGGVEERLRKGKARKQQGKTDSLRKEGK